MPCNRSTTNVNPVFWNSTYNIKIFLSDQDIKNLQFMGVLGGSAAGVYQGLSTLGVVSGALATPYTVIVGAVVAAYFGWVKYSNSGCGVVINSYIGAGGYWGTYVSSQ